MKEHKINLDGLTVCIGMPAYSDLDPRVVRSLFDTQLLCLKHRIICELAMVIGNSCPTWARDEVLDLFLQTDANRLFCIDSDIVWEPDSFLRLLALSTKRKIVCGSYVAKKDQPTFFIRYDENKTIEADEYGLLEIDGLGLGFTVLDREVVENITSKSEKVYDEVQKKSIPAIFRRGRDDGKRKGEDMAFFEDLQKLGYKIYIDPSIELGHIGRKIYTGKIMDLLYKEE